MIKPPFQWQLVQTQLDPVRGSEQAGTRPVLIVSHEAINAALTIVTVLPVTTLRPGRRIYSTEVVLPALLAGQPNDLIVMAHQIRTVAKKRLQAAFGRLEDEALRQAVRLAMRTHLDML